MDQAEFRSPRSTGAFPEELRRLSVRIWNDKKERDVDRSGRIFRHQNVFYLSVHQNPHLFSQWICPGRGRREEGVLWYITASSEPVLRWKGRAISENEIDKLIP